MNATLRPADHARHPQELFEPLSEQDRMLLMNIVTGLWKDFAKTAAKTDGPLPEMNKKRTRILFLPGPLVEVNFF